MIRAVVLVLGLAVVVAGCNAEEPTTEAPIRPVKSILVKPFKDQAPLFTGIVEPQVSTDYSFQILGRMISRDVDVGDEVTKGQLLASLDASVLQQGVEAARAALRGANATLANATGVAERQRALRESNTSTQVDVDNAEEALASARSAGIQAEASLEKAEEQLGYARLSAEFDGIVTSVAAEAGEVVAAGQTVLTLARPDLRDAVIDLPDAVAGLLRLGTPLQVALQLDAASFARGTVREIAPLADPMTRSRRVKIALQEPGVNFRLGSIVTVALPGDDAQALALPPSAVLDRAAPDKDGQTRVWVVAANGGSVSSRAVRVKRAPDGQWVVLSGIEEGERVVTAGVNSLSEGQRVKTDGAVR